MRTPAEAAIANTIKFEGKKDGLQQRQSGDWMLRLTIAAADMDERITHAAMGARFQVVMVEIGDDEEAIDHDMIERNKWADLSPARQAGIRCKDPIFRAWLMEERHCFGGSEEEAAQTVRDLCGVESRGDLDRPGSSRQRQAWYALDQQFQAWKVKEHG